MWKLAMSASVFAALALWVPAPTAAAPIVVPDDAPTIQAGIDMGADTVVVRPGAYPETLRVDRPVVLRGFAGDSIPQAMGLLLDNSHQQAAMGVTIRDFHFKGPVRNEFKYPYPMGPFTIGFEDCVMDSGITDEAQPEWDQISYSISGCRITGGVNLARPEYVYLAGNTIQGAVQLNASAYGLYVIGNTIDGPGPFGIAGQFRDGEAHILGNTVRGFEGGIYLAGRYNTIVRDNVVEDCSRSAIFIEDNIGFSHRVTGNTVRSSGFAISVNGAESLVLSGNVAEDCSSGMFALTGYAELSSNRLTSCGTGITIVNGIHTKGAFSRGNRIANCGGGLDILNNAGCASDRDTVTDCATGMVLEGSYVTLDSALVVSCGGPGVRVSTLRAWVTGSVVGRSQSDGFRVEAPVMSSISGNTSFLNGGSGFVVQDHGESKTNVERNIAFGNVQYGLSLAPVAALELSCNDWFGNYAGAIDGASPAASDLALDPMFCDLSANDARLAPASPLATAVGCGLIGALGTGCPAGATAGVLDAAPRSSGFSLTRVGPVPSRSGVALEMTLPRAAAIDLTVLDLQGRSIARLAAGGWSAGRHEIEWNGRGAHGRVPPGVYLIRFRYPGGQDARRVVISR